MAFMVHLYLDLFAHVRMVLSNLLWILENIYSSINSN